MKNLVDRVSLYVFLIGLFVLIGPIACTSSESGGKLETVTRDTFSVASSDTPEDSIGEMVTTPPAIVTMMPTSTDQVTPSPEITKLPTQITQTSELGSTEKQSAILIGSGLEYWIIFPDESRINQLPVGYQAYGWSPSGEQLLLWSVPVESRGLYIADADGTNPRLLDEYTLGAPGIETKWLTDDLILIQNRDMTEPRLFYMDAVTGKIQNTEEVYGRTLEAVFLNGEYWIQSIEGTNAIEIADLAGNRVEILQDYPNVRKTTQPIIHPNITFLPTGEATIFPACVLSLESNKRECNYWLANIMEQGMESIQPIYNLGENLQTSQFEVSPDSHFLAFSDIPGWIYFLNLETYQVDYRWPTNSVQINSLKWSPDSESIAYGVDDIETGKFSIMMLNIESGETTELLDGVGPVPRILDWQCLSVGQESN